MSSYHAQFYPGSQYEDIMRAIREQMSAQMQADVDDAMFFGTKSDPSRDESRDLTGEPQVIVQRRVSDYDADYYEEDETVCTLPCCNSLLWYDVRTENPDRHNDFDMPGMVQKTLQADGVYR
jgi:hypothetical protein